MKMAICAIGIYTTALSDSNMALKNYLCKFRLMANKIAHVFSEEELEVSNNNNAAKGALEDALNKAQSASEIKKDEGQKYLELSFDEVPDGDIVKEAENIVSTIKTVDNITGNVTPISNNNNNAKPNSPIASESKPEKEDDIKNRKPEKKSSGNNSSGSEAYASDDEFFWGAYESDEVIGSDKPCFPDYNYDGSRYLSGEDS
jgi:hypothetical protein